MGNTLHPGSGLLIPKNQFGQTIPHESRSPTQASCINYQPLQEPRLWEPGTGGKPEEKKTENQQIRKQSEPPITRIITV